MLSRTAEILEGDSEGDEYLKSDSYHFSSEDKKSGQSMAGVTSVSSLTMQTEEERPKTYRELF